MRAPSSSMSLSRKQTPCSTHAAWTASTTSATAAAAASGPSSVASESVPDRRMNAIAACRCSGSAVPEVTWSRIGRGTPTSSSSPSSGGSGAAQLGPRAVPPRAGTPSPRASPTASGGSAAAVAALTAISPAEAAASISTVAEAPGPADDQLAVVGAREHEEERAGMDADVHLQRDGACARPRTADRAEGPTHLERGAGGPRLVPVAVEEEEQCVAAELEQPAAVGVRDVEEARRTSRSSHR